MLLEVMLALRPFVASMGEMRNLGVALSPVLNAPDFEGINGWVERYLRSLPDFWEDAAFFIEKQPKYFFYTGFVTRFLPEARVLHLARDFRDVAFWTWRNSFTIARMSYSYDQSILAKFLNLCRRVMNFWDAQSGERFLTVRYDDLTSDPTAQTLRIARFLGMNWDEDMTRPEKTSAAVASASVVQVRQIVHNRSRGQWEHLGKGFDSVLDGLDAAL